jgi:acetyl-CoA acetyltransferase
MEARIVGAAESPYSRHPPPGTTTESLLTDAYTRALAAAGVERASVDGLGVASFTLAPDHVADLAWRLGVRARWLMEDTNGGAASLNMLQHAFRAVEAGDAATIVLAAGDHFEGDAFRRLIENYNRATVEELSPQGLGPNELFALLTLRHMAAHGLVREDYGRLVIAQRAWAERNPGAVYREPMTMEDYLAAPIVAEPLGRYDCVPVVSGADAIVVQRSKVGVAVRAICALHNPDGQQGDGLHTGLAEAAGGLWNDAGLGPGDMDAAYVYDDYPAMALIQLDDLGLVPDGEIARFVRDGGLEKLPVNTSGGQLSAGQAGAAGGMHGLVEAACQLFGTAGERTIGARRVVVSGYGMVLYRYGACSNAAVLEVV